MNHFPHIRCGIVIFSIFFMLLSGCTPPATTVSTDSPLASAPTKDVYGDLNVMHVYGDYESMGRQQVSLLGVKAQSIYLHNLQNYEEVIKSLNPFVSFIEPVGLPLGVSTGSWFDDSGFYEEIAGYSEELGVSKSDMLRSFLGNLGSGSTGFAATGDSTMDGTSIVGRNVDWGKGEEIFDPNVTFYHPNNGDLDFAIVGWPLLPIPAAGMNEAGLVLSYNFFNADDFITYTFPSFNYRLALQKAKTVQEAIAIISEGSSRAIAAFITLADASGAIAQLECTTEKCMELPLDKSWLAVSNHSQIPEMKTHDMYRLYNSFLRLEGMQTAVSAKVGVITPSSVPGILRYRKPESSVNDSDVANSIVFNSVIFHPKSRRFWHSNRSRPVAPFGDYIEFNFRDQSANPVWLPLEKSINVDLAGETESIELLRKVRDKYLKGDLGAALEGIQVLKQSTVLNRYRLLWFEALIHADHRRFEEAFPILTEVAAQSQFLELKYYSQFLQGWIRSKEGKAEEGEGLFLKVLQEMEEHAFFGKTYEAADIKKRIEKTRGSLPENLPFPKIHHYLF